MTTITLVPGNHRLEIAPGTDLRVVLSSRGLEFPCGGRARCGKCRVKVLSGVLPIDPEDTKLLTADELARGWRLACRHSVDGDLELELAQWEMPILLDHSRLNIHARMGLGIAVDLGTTTIAAQLLSLETGHVLGSRTALNAQICHGDDIMSRLAFALHGGRSELCRLSRDQVGGMVQELAGGRSLRRITLVGNTAMHHLFCDLDVATLAAYPFRPQTPHDITFQARDLGWGMESSVDFLPCIGGMVGSDTLAGIVATGLLESSALVALVDLGTNGEVTVGNRDRLLSTSTAAGPAFEGARITMGMRAAGGAIDGVEILDGKLRCQTVGDVPARGLCGSGLVDAVAAGLDLSLIEPAGRMTSECIRLGGPVALYPNDVRELQLAKAAIAAGLRILTAKLNAGPDDIQCLYLAGAFGNYIRHTSAARIGMFQLPPERIVAAGNTALSGAKRALFEAPTTWDGLADRVEHVALHADPGFEAAFVEEMRFPDPH